MIGGNIIAWADHSGEAASVIWPSRLTKSFADRRSAGSLTISNRATNGFQGITRLEPLQIWPERPRYRLFMPGDTESFL